jgi:plasmid stabilization system protein ParE
MKKYVLGKFVESDLDCIWEYIAQDNIEAADRWIAKLFDSFQTIANTPGMGHTREDLTSLPVCFWPLGAYLILYRHTEQVEIIAVTQEARDIPRFIRQRDEG